MTTPFVTTHPIPRAVLKKAIVVGAFVEGHLVDALGCDREDEIPTLKAALLACWTKATVMRKTNHVPAK